MEITNNFRFLRHQFPVLERLDVGLTLNCEANYPQYGFKAARFPQLRELYLLRVHKYTCYRISPSPTRFAVLQKLEISCLSTSDWPMVVQDVAHALVSLSLFVPYSHNDTHQTFHFSFPHLRHLQITRNPNKGLMTVDLDSPCLESIDDASGIGKGTVIRLRNPASVKQLHTGVFPLHLSPYSELRRLWIKGIARYSPTTLPSFRSQIASCPQLEAIFYCHPRLMEDEHSPPGSEFTAILKLVLESGRDIAVGEFLPNELDLPGAIPRSVGIPLSVILFIVVTNQNIGVLGSLLYWQQCVERN
jgi:hypothetical protein